MDINFGAPAAATADVRGGVPGRDAGSSLSASALRYHRGMQRDYLNNPVGAQRDVTLRGIDDFIEGFLGYETRRAYSRRRGHAR